MTSPSDSVLREYAAWTPDVPFAAQALRLAHEMGSVEAAHKRVERKVVVALRNGWRPSLYRYCGILLAFRRAMTPTPS